MGSHAALMIVARSDEVKRDTGIMMTWEGDSVSGRTLLDRCADQHFVTKNMLELGIMAAIIRSFINLCVILRRNDQ
jgi:hypothetical protein